MKNMENQASQYHRLHSSLSGLYMTVGEINQCGAVASCSVLSLPKVEKHSWMDIGPLLITHMPLMYLLPCVHHCLWHAKCILNFGSNLGHKCQAAGLTCLNVFCRERNSKILWVFMMIKPIKSSPRTCPTPLKLPQKCHPEAYLICI